MQQETSCFGLSVLGWAQELQYQASKDKFLSIAKLTQFHFGKISRLLWLNTATAKIPNPDFITYLQRQQCKHTAGQVPIFQFS